MQKGWPTRDTLTSGQPNVKSYSLADPKDVLLSPLDNPYFEFFYSKFPALSDVKIRAGMFIGSQIGKLIKESSFD